MTRVLLVDDSAVVRRIVRAALAPATEVTVCGEARNGAEALALVPVLKPGESFEYTSGTPLPTPSGIMLGTYEMETQKGERFDVTIPPFSLDSPHQSRSVN